MAELRHLLSDESMLTLRAVQAQSEDPTVVELMTRSELYDHFAIRGKLGASQEEIVAKLQHWKDARDIQRVMSKARRLQRKKEKVTA